MSIGVQTSASQTSGQTGTGCHALGPTALHPQILGAQQTLHIEYNQVCLWVTRA